MSHDRNQKAEKALEELSWLRALALRLVHDPHAAEDVVQDTLIVAMGDQPRNEGSLRGWLRSVMRNVVRQERRAHTRRVEREGSVPVPTESPATLDIVAELSLHRRVVEMVHELEEPYRTVVVRRFLHGKTPREIAREQHVPVKTVHTRIERGLQRLRQKLDREHGGERSAWVLSLMPLAQARHGLWGLKTGWVISMYKAAGVCCALVFLALLPTVWRSDAPTEMEALDEPRPTGTVAEVSPLPSSPAMEDIAAERTVPVATESSDEAVEPAGPVFDGLVRDFEGRAIPEIEVVFEAQRDLDYARVSEFTTTSSEEGDFTMSLPGEEGRVSVISERYSSIARPYMGGTLPHEPPVVVVAPRHRYAGIVVDDADRPVENATVEISLEGDWLQSFEIDGRVVHMLLPFVETTTDDQGRFRFESVGFVKGAHLEASRAGHEALRIDLPEQSRDDLVLSLGFAEGVDAIHGLVQDAAGQPAAQARVSLGKEAVLSGPDGRFVLPRKRWPKSGTVMALKQGYQPGEAPFGAEEDAGSSREDPLTITLGPAGLTIAGTLVDATGKALSNVAVYTPDTTYFGEVGRLEGGLTVTGATTVEALVRGEWESWTRPIEVRTDLHGHFELRGLVERDYAVFAMDPKTLAHAEPRLVRAGEKNLRLRLKSPEPRRVAGRIVSTLGVPIAGVSVMTARTPTWERPVPRPDHRWNQGAVQAPGDGRAFYSEPAAYTNDEGFFEIEGIEVDGTRLVFNGALTKWDSRVLDPAEDLENLEIELEAMCRFRVVLAGDPGEAVAFSRLDERGSIRPLFVRVEAHTISTGKVDLHRGRSDLIEAYEGEGTLVLYNASDEEVRRKEVTFEGGEVMEIRL